MMNDGEFKACKILPPHDRNVIINRLWFPIGLDFKFGNISGQTGNAIAFLEKILLFVDACKCSVAILEGP